ncbi:hypothetical protein [Sinorhizobium meliloti]|uniref:hypothetical protein n=1 Tax=Rhizobium meliloti TaxID=382 RepID=UPI003F160A53
MTIDAAKEMIRRHVLLKAEIVEELRRSRLKSHHSPDPLQITQRIESRVSSASNDEFFNTIGAFRPMALAQRATAYHPAVTIGSGRHAPSRDVGSYPSPLREQNVRPRHPTLGS